MKQTLAIEYILVGSILTLAILSVGAIGIHLATQGWGEFKAYLPLFIAPFLGWWTNWIALRMLFRPYEPPALKGLSQFQGVIPRRREQIANKVGAMIERKLLTHDDLQHVVKEMDLDGAVRSAVNTIIDRELSNTVIPSGILRSGILRSMKEAIIKKILDNMEHVHEETIPELLAKIDIHQMVTERLNSFTNEELESTVLSVAERELKHLVLLGGGIGLVIGLIQTALNLWL